MDKYHWLDQSSKSLFENIQRDLGINNFDDVSVDRSIDFALKISNQLTERGYLTIRVYGNTLYWLLPTIKENPPAGYQGYSKNINLKFLSLVLVSST